MPTAQKPVIFLAFANDRQEGVRYLRNLPEEKRQILERLSEAEDAGLCEIVVKTNTTVKELLDVFQEYRERVAIFHFAGHAHPETLYLESREGNPSLVNAATLSHFLSSQPGIRLVFLNGCSTEKQVEHLLENGIEVVIATSQDIVDETASQFAARFYNAIAHGATLESAYSEAVHATKIKSGESNLHRGERAPAEVTHGGGRWPWAMYVAEGAEINKGWSLSKEANKPLFGIPEPEPHSLPDSPYQYIFRYDEEHVGVFFGRDQEIREIYDRVTSKVSRPIILFYGNSAIGKSSLLRAGLIPRLKQTHHVRYASRDIRLGLSATIDASISTLFSSTVDASHLSNSIHEKWLAIEETSGKPLVLILDQIEEVYTAHNHESELNEFIQLLLTLFGKQSIRPKGRLLLSFRKEWLAEFDALLKQHRLPRSEFFLNRLSRSGVIEVVLGPTNTQLDYNLTVEHPLEGIIADDLLEDQEAPVAPMLSILMTKMWEICKNESDHGRTFTIDAYQGLKRKGLLLDDFLDSRLGELTQWNEEVIASGLILDILNYHTTEFGTAAIHTLKDLRSYYTHRLDVLEDLLDQSQNRHLLIRDEKQDDDGESQTVIRLTHDILAPLIRKRHNESNYPGQEAARLLQNRASEWQKGKGQPLDEAGLSVVEKGQQGMRMWTDIEKRLVEESRVLRTKLKRRRNIVYGLLTLIIGGLAWTYSYINRFNICEFAGTETEWCRSCIDKGGKWKGQGDNDGATDCEGASFNPPNLATDFEEIYPGSFMMGSEDYEDEAPVHQVVIAEPFLMGKTEVTQAQWYAVMGTNRSGTKGENLPAQRVSWNDTQEYIHKLNTLSNCPDCFRLPTEAEWEYACRAGNENEFGIDEGELSEYAWHEAQGMASMQPVATLKPNKYGVFDMSGNVYEWVQDWYAPYDSTIIVDPRGAAEGERRVIRGGAFNGRVSLMRCSDRYGYEPTDRATVRGFRLAAKVQR
ncbi:MAG: SUMF1/EgtB/PvdO family nonheme iron enzyme [Rhodothermaceae bacterium]|nr:SUMF1/EgtB/PvdO family nonheme iron enzyme [Rhodothermaceae bacterium]